MRPWLSCEHWHHWKSDLHAFGAHVQLGLVLLWTDCWVFTCVQIWALLAVLHALCGLAWVTVEMNQFLSQRKSQIFSTNRTSQCTSEPATSLLFTPQSTLTALYCTLMWNRVIKLKCLIYRIWKTKILITFKPLFSLLNLCVHKNVSLTIWEKNVFVHLLTDCMCWLIIIIIINNNNNRIIKLLKQTWHHKKLALLVYDLRGFKSSIFTQVTFCSSGMALFMWFPCNVLFLSQVLSASIIVCYFWMHSLYQWYGFIWIPLESLIWRYWIGEPAIFSKNIFFFHVEFQLTATIRLAMLK